MGILRSSSAVFAVLLSAFIYYRSSILYTFYANSPARLQRINELDGAEVLFKNNVRNCEDVYLNDEEGFAVLSCDPGRDSWNTVMGTFVDPVQPPETGLYLYRYAESPGVAPTKLKLRPMRNDDLEFHPLGIEYDVSSRTLFVANHLSLGSRLDIYSLNIDEGLALQTGSIQYPQIAAPNSIAAASDTELFVTNDHYFRAGVHPLLSKLESYAGIPGGSVVHIKILRKGAAQVVQVTTLAHLPFANGIAFLNTSTLAVASTTGCFVRLFHVDRSSSEDGVPKLVSIRTIPMPFLPDNLSVDGNGKLLIAGHPHAPSVEAVSKNNRFCDHTAANDTSPPCALPRLSHIAEWDEAHGLKILFAGDLFGTSTTAVRDVSRGVGFASGLYERGLLTWKS